MHVLYVDLDVYHAIDTPIGFVCLMREHGDKYIVVDNNDSSHITDVCRYRYDKVYDGKLYSSGTYKPYLKFIAPHYLIFANKNDGLCCVDVSKITKGSLTKADITLTLKYNVQDIDTFVVSKISKIVTVSYNGKISVISLNQQSMVVDKTVTIPDAIDGKVVVTAVVHVNDRFLVAAHDKQKDTNMLILLNHDLDKLGNSVMIK